MNLQTWQEVQAAVETFITFYNEHYPHSTLRYRNAVEFEQQLESGSGGVNTP